ncbi:hypothetical protein N7493_002451 [Penicillium malachiteum]|uniref:Glycolipid transfer protein domain-containing protein n=1 Tax=Penicillium malachiteum TaxID=1324776 RepID=A0AAD6HRZ8_9EURO|nr:hypothetical protein N7493_002451 [Penicillium malachiteum]
MISIPSTFNCLRVNPPELLKQLGTIPINTEEFLRAAESLVTLFYILGSIKFKAVIEDLNKNITKIKTRMLAAPTESQSLQDLVLSELKTGKHTATEGLLWLGRSLDFTVQSLRHNLDNPSADLSESFTTGYKATLSSLHPFYVRGVFNMAMGYCPKRATFYRQLADKNYVEGQKDVAALDAEVNAEVMPALTNEVIALERVVKILKTFQASKEAQWK